VPVFFDLNGDGQNEVVVASRGPEIRIVQPPNTGEGGKVDGDTGVSGDGDVFAAVKTIATASLMPANVRVSVGRHAIAMAVGHLTPPSEEHGAGSRKAVVVVVTASWHVLCFDHNLKLMWQGLTDDACQRAFRTLEFNRPISVYRFPRRAPRLCMQLCMGIQPAAGFPR